MCKDCGCHEHNDAIITLSVSGMMCEHCKKAVEKALEALGGVFHITVDLERGLVSFCLNDETSLDAVKKAIEEQGYTVG